MKFRICHVITRMIVGGAQENTLLTVRGLMEHGHDVVLLTGPSPGPEGKLLAAMQVPGLQLVEEPDLVREIDPRRDFAAYRAMVRYFRRERFDIVHTHSSKAGVLGRLAAHRAGVPIVVHTIHGQAFHPYEKWWRNRLYILSEKWAARYSHRILAVAQAMVDQSVAAGVAPADRYRVVYSGMDMQSFTTARRDPALRTRLGIPPEAPVVGKVARLFELKGHDYLLAAAPAIVHEFPEVRFLLVGDGILRQKLEEEAEQRGVRRNFVFAGLVPPSDVPRYMAQMDVLVHLSLREGLPRTVVQALATGVPAVGFDLDGTPEVIRPGQTGFLCHAGDVACVQESVLRLLRNPEEARTTGRRGQDQVREQFDWHHMVDVIEQEYVACARELNLR